MPIYEYKCTDCGECFDALRTMSQADAPIPCEHCSSNKTTRKVSAAFAHSGGRVVPGGGGNGSGCGSCRGGSCGSCSH